MKRHPSLVPLSREHHEALILAQLVKKNAPAYKGLPETVGGKKQYALAMFSNHLLPHFKKEEMILEQVAGCHQSIAQLAAVIITEHKELAALFNSLETAPDTASVLDKTGYLLESHIRKEERELFPLIQEHCTEEILQQLK